MAILLCWSSQVEAAPKATTDTPLLTSLQNPPQALLDKSNSNTFTASRGRGNGDAQNLPFEISNSTTPQSITITTPAIKLTYTVGDTLDITGLVVTGTSSDGSTTPQAITVANITGFDSTVVAKDQVLTIAVGEKTVTYKVQIVAAEDTTEIGTTTPIVDPTKVWTIKLSGVVNESSLNGKVYVTNAKGIKQKITCTVTSTNGLSQIEVKPDKNYVPGDYILWVKNIKSIKEVSIKKQVFMKFTVK